jgi:TetR/AcrR family transcriptional regulator, transcriptional repressor for nem operon
MLTAIRKREGQGTGRKKRGASAPRDPERTRTVLLETAFGEIYRGGFQGTGLDRILSRAKVTKGALYHYFDSKEKLGYAIVEEVIAEITRQKWLNPLAGSPRPLNALIGIVEGTSVRQQDVEGGCPLNNLAQEMSPVDEGFRKRVARVFAMWTDAVAGAVREGQKLGQVRRDIDAEETARFFIATYEGYISLAKTTQDPEVLREGMGAMKRYLEGLRAG